MHTVNWFQLLLFNTNYSIQRNSFICTQSNGSKYCYAIPIIQFRHTVQIHQVLLFQTNNSIQHYTFVCTQIKGSKYCYVSQTIQLDISHLFTQLNDQRVMLLKIQFSIRFHTVFMSNSFIRPMDRTLSGAITLVQSVLWCYGNEGLPPPKAPDLLEPNHQMV